MAISIKKRNNYYIYFEGDDFITFPLSELDNSDVRYENGKIFVGKTKYDIPTFKTRANFDFNDEKYSLTDTKDFHMTYHFKNLLPVRISPEKLNEFNFVIHKYIIKNREKIKSAMKSEFIFTVEDKNYRVWYDKFEKLFNMHPVNVKISPENTSGANDRKQDSPADIKTQPSIIPRKEDILIYIKCNNRLSYFTTDGKVYTVDDLTFDKTLNDEIEKISQKNLNGKKWYVDNIKKSYMQISGSDIIYIPYQRVTQYLYTGSFVAVRVDGKIYYITSEEPYDESGVINKVVEKIKMAKNLA